jgi:SAM-dependent methyltransferase
MIKNDSSIAGFFPATVMPDPDWWGVLWPHPEEVLASLGVRPDMEAVDLCCGYGLFTVPLALSTKHVIGIDIDPGMLALARERAVADRAVACEFLEGNAYDLAELVTKPIDFVLVANTFHGVPDQTQLARTVATTLKPDGHFAIVNWHRLPREETTVLGVPRGPKTDLRMTPADTANVVEAGGFTQVDVVQLRPYHYGAIFGKRAA